MQIEVHSNNVTPASAFYWHPIEICKQRCKARSISSGIGVVTFSYPILQVLSHYTIVYNT